ncbi:MAG: hypothetical protein ACRDCN_11235 [Tannerellaceae bacterium]
MKAEFKIRFFVHTKHKFIDEWSKGVEMTDVVKLPYQQGVTFMDKRGAAYIGALKYLKSVFKSRKYTQYRIEIVSINLIAIENNKLNGDFFNIIYIDEVRFDI